MNADHRRINAEQNELRGDIELAARYGEARPNEWTDIRFENGVPVQIVIAFARNVDEHRRALEAMVAHPDRLVVEEARYSHAETEAFRQELEERLFAGAAPVLTIGGSFGVVTIELGADGLSVAEDLHRHYGDRVELTVGARSYPPRDEDANCPALADNDAPPGLTARVVVDQAPARAGAYGRGRIIVRNGADHAQHVSTGEPQVGRVLAPDSRRVVGVFVGGIKGVGAGKRLAPGEEMDLTLLFGTASCDPALGYALPPGEYDLVAEVDLHESAGTSTRRVRHLVSEPVRFEIPPS